MVEPSKIDEEAFIRDYNRTMIDSPAEIDMRPNTYSDGSTSIIKDIMSYKEYSVNMDAIRPRVTEPDYIDSVLNKIISGNKSNLEFTEKLMSDHDINGYKDLTWVCRRINDPEVFGSDIPIFKPRLEVVNYSKNEVKIALDITFILTKNNFHVMRSGYSHTGTQTLSLTPTLAKKWLKDKTPEKLLELYKEVYDKSVESNNKATKKKNIKTGTSALMENAFWSNFNMKINEIIENDEYSKRIGDRFKNNFSLNKDKNAFRCASNCEMTIKIDTYHAKHGKLVFDVGSFNQRFWTKSEEQPTIKDYSEDFFKLFEDKIKSIKRFIDVKHDESEFYVY